MPTPHIEAIEEDIAKIVLMPGDPKRCEYIATNFLVGSRLVNSLRGATAYTGYYKDVRVTVFPSGMGIPSMGIYSHELFNNYNVDIIVRVGTAGAYDKSLKIYDILLATSAYSNTIFDEESLSKSINTINSSMELNTVIKQTASNLGLEIQTGRVHTVDAFYSFDDSAKNNAIKNECVAVEMEAFALLLNAKKYHKRATVIVTISDETYSDRELSAKEREVKLNSMITLTLESIIKFKK